MIEKVGTRVDIKSIREPSPDRYALIDMAEHIYMFSGKSIIVKMKTTEDMLTRLTDWFGGDFRVLEKGAGVVTVKVTCNEKAMRFWALQYGPYVEIISPVSLREKIKDDILKMAKKYES